MKKRYEFFFQGSKFGILSVLSVFLTLSVTITAHEVLTFTEEVSYCLALVVVFLVNFLGMRYFVYPKNNHKKHLVRQFLEFLITSFLFRSIEFLLFIVIHSWFGINYLIAIMLVMIVSIIGKFIFYKYTVFD